ncbi:MAG: hypothetical protein LBR26_07520 [Prevotella sp.]|jgi:hypothetical protein|nr:hypothetical protein [Prevotella sp.]
MQNIQNKTAGKNHRDHSFEDFLDDGFFISSVRQSTEEIRAFWCKFARGKKSELKGQDWHIRRPSCFIPKMAGMQ